MTHQEIQTILQSLESAPGLILPMIRSMPEEERNQRPASGKWSAHEHACHLSEVDLLMLSRLDLMLREDHPVIASYDPGQNEDPDRLLKKDLEESLAAFEKGRSELILYLRDLDPIDWARTADHEEYRTYSVFIMFRHLAMHDLFHAYRIEELLL